MPYHFDMTSVREYTLHFNKGEVGKDFNLKRISVVSDSRTSHPYAEFYEKINYILFNPQKIVWRSMLMIISNHLQLKEQK